MGKVLSAVKHLTKPHNSSEEYYNNMNTDVVGLNGTNNTRWMSLGYWKHAEDYNSACEEMADNYAAFGKLEAAENLLDVGCGCGEQDFYWKGKYPKLKITAGDITEMQIQLAQERAEKEAVDIEFTVSDACKQDFQNDSFDRVSALDCIYHFVTRENFFDEAYRVLKKDGILFFTDMLPVKNEESFKKDQIEGRSALFYPEENVYPIKTCIELLKKSGFRDVEYKEIGSYVFKGATKYFITRFLHPNKPINEIKVKFNHKRWQRFYNKLFGHMYGTSEYYFVRAVK